mmetsp:Transcript_142658/g.248768  ORF Transcript_142658/g.248768 Transcript_142658/m.248768 type:complete len:271 (+) Transcript_142658:19-831(+)
MMVSLRCVWVCLLAACLQASRGNAGVAKASGGACQSSALLQVKAVRSRHAATPASSEPSCPDDGEQCTLIAVQKEGAHVFEDLKKYKFFNHFVVTKLESVGELILDFGKHRPDECCEAYKTLQGIRSVQSVEFDAVVHTSVALPPVNYSHQTQEDNSSSTSIAPPCPTDGHRCTLIVIQKDGVSILETLTELYEDIAYVSLLSAIGQIRLDFGKHNADKCCEAFKALQGTSVVKAVEFDSPVYPVEKSKAGTTCAWPVLLWILGHLSNAF